MSINDLVRKEAQRQIDLVIEAIPIDNDKFSTPIGKAKLQYENSPIIHDRLPEIRQAILRSVTPA